MDQLYLLWFLSISMLVGSFLSGMIPMAFKLSDNKSRLLALLGSGILVGTALAIIIPEGIDSLYGQAQPFSIKGSEDGKISIPSNVEQNKINENIDSHKPSATNKTWIVGISLIVGFVLMLLIDQFTLYQAKSDTHQSNGEVLNCPQDYSYTTLASQDDDPIMGEVNNEVNIEDPNIIIKKEPISGVEVSRKISRNLDTGSNHINLPIINTNPNRYYDHSRTSNHNQTKAIKVTPTLGLVIHAAADGIALGAAATTSHRDVEMIIFLAIMLHKAPAAFSLVVLLLHRGLRYSTIRKHLLAFSLSAPIAAIFTYYGLSQSGKETLRENNATGIAMLFSAGTFLFVATVHVLPELIHNKLLSPKEMLFLIAGSFLPLILAQTI